MYTSSKNSLISLILSELREKNLTNKVVRKTVIPNKNLNIINQWKIRVNSPDIANCFFVVLIIPQNLYTIQNTEIRHKCKDTTFKIQNE